MRFFIGTPFPSFLPSSPHENRCKNGARNILFLWIGDDSPPDLRAALAIQWSTITPPNVAADHVQVRQSTEPPIFSAICFHHFHCPLCIVDGLDLSEDSPREPIFLVFDFYMPYLGLQGMCPSLIQTYPQTPKISRDSLLPLSPNRCRLTMRLEPSSGQPQQWMLFLSAQMGRDCGSLFSEAVEKIVSKAQFIMTMVMESAAATQSHRKEEEKIHSPCQPKVIQADSGKVALSRTTIDPNTEFSDYGESISQRQRPVRLFRVSLSLFFLILTLALTQKGFCGSEKYRRTVC